MEGIERALTERVQTLVERHNLPGIAVGVDLRGTTAFVCRGVTHVNHPLPIDPDTLFQIASNTKPFTATLVMQLVAEGALGLDDSVRKHLPELRMPERRYDDAVTVRHLLSHRVGIDGDALFVRQPVPPTLDNLFDGFRAHASSFRPALLGPTAMRPSASPGGSSKCCAVSPSPRFCASASSRRSA